MGQAPAGTGYCLNRDVAILAAAAGWDNLVGFGLRLRISSLLSLRSHAQTPAEWMGYRSPGHHVDGGFMAEILFVRNATRWLRLKG